MFVSTPPLTGKASGWNWTQVNDTQLPQQPSNGLVVAAANGRGDACCYKAPYPTPNPVENPVPTPVAQTDRQTAIFANRSALAANHSATAFDTVVELVEFCSKYTVDNISYLFAAAECPGMADVTENGTLAPYPSAEQILERFTSQLRAAEYSLGFSLLTLTPNVSNVFNPSYEFALNAWESNMLGVPDRVTEQWGVPSATAVSYTHLTLPTKRIV